MGLFGAIGSIVSTGMSNAANRKATRSTNATNLKINQMNNQFNAREAIKNRTFITSERNAQNDWNLEQWNRENEYNSASAQRKRLEEAGLNPYLMMDGGSSGTAGSVVGGSTSSGSSASSSGNAVMQPVRYDFSGISDAINSYFVNKKLTSETVGQNITNQFGPDFQRSQIASMLDGRFELLDPNYQARRSSMGLNYLGLDFNTKLQQLESARAYTELNLAQSSLTYLNADSQRVLNKYLDSQQQGDLMIKSASIFETYTRGELNEKKAQTEIKNAVLATLQASSLKQSIRSQKTQNEIAEGTAYNIMKAMQAEHNYNAEYYKALKQYARSIGQSDADEKYWNSILRRYEAKMSQFHHGNRSADRELNYWDKFLKHVPKGR